MKSKNKDKKNKFKKYYILLLLIVGIFVFGATKIEAASLHVNSSHPNCNDSTAYSQNNQDNPWCTIGRASWGGVDRTSPNSNEAAQAGDVVYVYEGTYTTTGTAVRYEPVYNPVNTGTINEPITFQAEGEVVLEQTGEGPLIGALNKNYIVWKGFTIYEINALATSDTGPIVLWSTLGSIIEDCEIDGWDNGRLGSNHNAIRIEYAQDVIVRNNKIYNVLNYGEVHMNGAGIMAYYSNGAIIENNEIYGCGSGVFVKGGDNENFTVRNNLVYDNGFGIIIQYTSTTGMHKVYKNIVIDSSIVGITGRLNGHNIYVVNNVLFNNEMGIQGIHWEDEFSNYNVFNNIISQSSGELFNGGELTNINELYIDRNLYTTESWSINYNYYSSFSNWRNILGGCPGIGNDCNSIISDPLFVNSVEGDFRLQEGSPALTLGRDILNLSGQGENSVIPAGAYIIGDEVIGIVSESTQEDTTPPAAPSGLSVS